MYFLNNLLLMKSKMALMEYAKAMLKFVFFLIVHVQIYCFFPFFYVFCLNGHALPEMFNK